MNPTYKRSDLRCSASDTHRVSLNFDKSDDFDFSKLRGDTIGIRKHKFTCKTQEKIKSFDNPNSRE